MKLLNAIHKSFGEEIDLKGTILKEIKILKVLLSIIYSTNLKAIKIAHL